MLHVSHTHGRTEAVCAACVPHTHGRTGGCLCCMLLTHGRTGGCLCCMSLTHGRTGSSMRLVVSPTQENREQYAPRCLSTTLGEQGALCASLFLFLSMGEQGALCASLPTNHGRTGSSMRLIASLSPREVYPGLYTQGGISRVVHTGRYTQGGIHRVVHREVYKELYTGRYTQRCTL